MLTFAPNSTGHGFPPGDAIISPKLECLTQTRAAVAAAACGTHGPKPSYPSRSKRRSWAKFRPLLRCGTVLALAHQRRKRIVAGREAQTQLLDRRSCGRLVRPLSNFEGFAAERLVKLAPCARHYRQIGEMMLKIICMLVNQTI